MKLPENKRRSTKVHYRPVFLRITAAVNMFCSEYLIFLSNQCFYCSDPFICDMKGKERGIKRINRKNR